MKLLSVFVLAAIVACGPPPVSPTRSDVVTACAALRSFGCPEGDGAPGGGDSCEVIVARRHELHPLPLACWTSKKTAAEAKGCGSLRCIR